MTRALLVTSLFLCGCSSDPCVTGVPDGCISSSVETLSCDVQRADGGVAAGVSAQCTGPEDAGATTDTSGHFQISITVRVGGFAGWSDDCGELAFRDGQTSLTPRDGGVRAWRLKGENAAPSCLVVVE